MTIERTLSIIKPDAVANRFIGEIYRRFETNGFHIIAAKMLVLTREQATEFYSVHKDQSFFPALIDYMISGPVVVTVIKGESVVKKHRILMGATIPEFAAPGSIRYDLSRNGKSNENSVHGSDSIETAEKEINFFFKQQEICDQIR